jgi:hypothetical protein
MVESRRRFRQSTLEYRVERSLTTKVDLPVAQCNWSLLDV